MPEFVRVKQNDTGHELTVPTGHFEAVESGYTLLKKDAVDLGGAPLPAKYKTSVSAEAAKKSQSGQKAESTKENS